MIIIIDIQKNNYWCRCFVFSSSHPFRSENRIATVHIVRFSKAECQIGQDIALFFISANVNIEIKCDKTAHTHCDNIIYIINSNFYLRIWFGHIRDKIRLNFGLYKNNTSSSNRVLVIILESF